MISDDIYNRMIFDGLEYAHLVKARPELRDRVIIVDSISKTYGMPGWRVGMVAGPESVAQSQVTLNSNHITSLPEVVTAAATAAFDGPQDIPRRQVQGFPEAPRRSDGCARQDSRRELSEAAGRVLCVPGYLRRLRQEARRSATINNDVDFCNALLEAKGVACVPGSAFGEPRAIRISYTCKPSELTDGLKRLQDFFAELK